MIVKRFTFNPFMTNCYVCHDDGQTAIIDPSASMPGECKAVTDYIETKGLSVKHLLLTHAHIDHIFGCAYFSVRYGLRFQMHADDVPLLEWASDQAALFGLDVTPPPAPDETFLDEDDTIQLGRDTWHVLHTPGHSPGSICFHDAENKTVISGDVLFQGSIGRTDLWQGSLADLMTSIHQNLMTLDDKTVVYPGHGPETTIGRERKTNPFLTGATTPF